MSDVEDRIDPIRTNRALPSDLPVNSLNFVRSRMRKLQAENQDLKRNLDEANRKLLNMTTAQSWAMDRAGTEESPWSKLQAQKLRELELLLAKADEARLALSQAPEAPSARSSLVKCRAEAKALRERLAWAFERGKELQEENMQFKEKLGKLESERRQKIPREIQEKAKKLESLGRSMIERVGKMHFNIHEP